MENLDCRLDWRLQKCEPTHEVELLDVSTQHAQTHSLRNDFTGFTIAALIDW